MEKRGNFEDQAADRITLKWFFKKEDEEAVDWIDVAQDRERWWDIVKMAVN